jgi:hypothetical protein
MCRHSRGQQSVMQEHVSHQLAGLPAGDRSPVLSWTRSLSSRSAAGVCAYLEIVGIHGSPDALIRSGTPGSLIRSHFRCDYGPFQVDKRACSQNAYPIAWPAEGFFLPSLTVHSG